MFKTAELFIKALEEEDMRYIEINEADDFVLIPVGYRLSHTNIKIFVLFEGDDGMDVTLRCSDYIHVSEEQYPQALMCCNDFNKEMRWVKFYIDDDQDVILEIDAMIDELTGGQEVFELLMRMLTIADDTYPKINKAIWA